jgi:hypothetical protein
MQQSISVGNLLLDVGNYRIVKRDSQKEARDAIIAEQGRKLVKLAADILEVGLSPIDLTLVVDAGDGNNNFIVIEGNRRLTALQLMLTPELSDGTPIFTAFKKLNKDHADAIPKVLDCVVAPNRKAGLVWIKRKHSNGLEGAGTEHWTAMAKARADAQEGLPRPELDAVNFVLSSPQLDEDTRTFLEGSQFNITTLERLIKARDVQKAVGFDLQDGKIISDQDRERMRVIFTDLVTIIKEGKHDGDKFTERNVDTEEHRSTFLEKFTAKHPKKKKAASPWEISGTPKNAKVKTPTNKAKGTPSTEDQPNLIPKKFKLQLPAGKINDIFVELKELDVIRRRHAVSVLFRVFFEMTLEDYIAKHGIQLPTDKHGNVRDSLLVKLNAVKEHAKSSNLMSDKELKPINVAISDRDSFLSPETLNAYVHSAWMNPDPLQLKLCWAGCQLFVERLWTSKK